MNKAGLVILLLLVLVAMPVTQAMAWESRKAISTAREAETSAAKTEPLKIRLADGGQHVFNVELAVRPEEVMRGLMYRTDLPEDGGMLFLFSGSEERYFWMKNTYIPLDIVFIRPDGVIHHIHENAVPHDLTHIPSRGPVSAVLEVRGGTAERLGLKPGDRIADSRFFSQ